MTWQFFKNGKPTASVRSSHSTSGWNVSAGPHRTAHSLLRCSAKWEAPRSVRKLFVLFLFLLRPFYMYMPQSSYLTVTGWMAGHFVPLQKRPLLLAAQWEDWILALALTPWAHQDLGVLNCQMEGLSSIYSFTNIFKHLTWARHPFRYR